MIDGSGKGVEWEGGKMMSSVLSMLSLRNREEKKDDMANRYLGNKTPLISRMI